MEHSMGGIDSLDPVGLRSKVPLLREFPPLETVANWEGGGDLVTTAIQLHQRRLLMAHPSESESSTVTQPHARITAIQVPFRALSNRVTQLHWRWQLFHQLYVTGQRRVELLNESAGGFFHELQWIMRDELVLSTARLLDRNRDSLSLFRLLE